jgi:hypothetical protein
VRAFYVGALALSVLALVASCENLPTAEPIEPSQEVDISPALAPEAQTPAAPVSTICSAYRDQLTLLEMERDKRPDDARLSEATVAFEGIIANACN